MNTIKERKIESLKNKFSFGISLDINIDDYKKIIKKYQTYIRGVYFSLPLGNEFHTRQLVVREYCKTDSEEKLLNILKLFTENNIKLEAVLNQYNIPDQKILQAVEYIKTKLEIDAICILDEYVKTIKKYFPHMYLVSSFNNYEKIKYEGDTPYNEIVVGRKFLRDIKNIKELRKLGLDVKFLLNNGCSFNCGTCRSGQENCKKVFDLNIKKFTAEELYALQSFWPFELNKLNEKINLNDIKEFKISNRPCTYEYLDKCLNSYIFCDEKKEDDFIAENINNYRLWGRLAHFNEYFSTMDIKRIKRIKNELWDLV